MADPFSKTYTIHDNGGRPFQVRVLGRDVLVLKNTDIEPAYDEYEPLFSIVAEEVFVGRASPTGGYDGLSPEEAEGNSILLRVSPERYRYIGDCIYDFRVVPGDTIEAYYSDIGPNDVPYPYAVGRTHIYILLEKVAVEKSYFDMGAGIYEQYYFEHRASMSLRGYEQYDLCLEKAAVRARIAEFKEKRTKLWTRTVARRLGF